MLTFLVWAASVYAAIWAATAIFLYRIDKKYCVDTDSRALGVWSAAFIGMLWPVVLALLAWLVWQGIRSED